MEFSYVPIYKEYGSACSSAIFRLNNPNLYFSIASRAWSNLGGVQKRLSHVSSLNALGSLYVLSSTLTASLSFAFSVTIVAVPRSSAPPLLGVCDGVTRMRALHFVMGFPELFGQKVSIP